MSIKWRKYYYSTIRKHTPSGLAVSMVIHGHIHLHSYSHLEFIIYVERKQHGRGVCECTTASLIATRWIIEGKEVVLCICYTYIVNECVAYVPSHAQTQACTDVHVMWLSSYDILFQYRLNLLKRSVSEGNFLSSNPQRVLTSQALCLTFSQSLWSWSASDSRGSSLRQV